MNIDVGVYSDRLSGILDSVFSPLLGAGMQSIQAQIQAQIGEFLAMKTQLMSRTGSTDPQVAAQAQQLLTNQIGLERDLSNLMPSLNQMQAGTMPDASSMGGLASFSMSLAAHMSSAKRFVSSTSGSGAFSNYFVLAAIGVGAWMLLKR